MKQPRSWFWMSCDERLSRASSIVSLWCIYFQFNAQNQGDNKDTSSCHQCSRPDSHLLKRRPSSGPNDEELFSETLWLESRYAHAVPAEPPSMINECLNEPQLQSASLATYLHLFFFFRTTSPSSALSCFLLPWMSTSAIAAALDRLASEKV